MDEQQRNGQSSSHPTNDETEELQLWGWGVEVGGGVGEGGYFKIKLVEFPIFIVIRKQVTIKHTNISCKLENAGFFSCNRFFELRKNIKYQAKKKLPQKSIYT